MVGEGGKGYVAGSEGSGWGSGAGEDDGGECATRLPDAALGERALADGAEPSWRVDRLRNLAGEDGLEPEACAAPAAANACFSYAVGISLSSCGPAGADGLRASVDGRPPKLKLFLRPDSAFSASALVDAT